MYYSAEHIGRGAYRGWCQYPPAGNATIGQIVMTPQVSPTRREAIAAIKAQHPGKGY